MVRILTNVGFTQPAQNLINAFPDELAGTLAVDTYQSVLVRRRLPAGAYVFGDLDRVPAGDAAAVLALWDQLQASGAAFLVNDPRRVRLRYALLRALHDGGINDFNVYRADEDLGRVRFPVFVRYEHDHGGPRTPLLHSPDELARALVNLRGRRAWRGTPLVVEAAAAPDDDGLFRKYGALFVHGRVIACHLIAARTWMVKGRARVVTPAIAEEELRFVIENPHDSLLRDVFAAARIDYGRVDYGFFNGRIQVYEINTNPSIVGRGVARHPERRPKRQHLGQRLIEAFDTMASDARATRGAHGDIALMPRPRLLPGWAYRGWRWSDSAWRRAVERSGIR